MSQAETTRGRGARAGREPEDSGALLVCLLLLLDFGEHPTLCWIRLAQMKGCPCRNVEEVEDRESEEGAFS
jgi:hypothetical protein